MTTNEAVRIVAEYDGWKPEHPFMKYADGTHAVAPMPPYLHNLNELHRVALGVMKDLDAVARRWPTKKEFYRGIQHAFVKPPVNSEYIDLLLAVARGIEFINQSKTA